MKCEYWGPYGMFQLQNLSQEGRIVNTASASGPNYNAGAPAAEREMLTSPATWLFQTGLSNTW